MPSTTPKAHVRRETRRPSFFWPLAALVMPVVDASVKYRYHRLDRFPAEGSVVIAPNHYSEIDPIVVAAAIYKKGRLPRFLAKASLFRIPVVGAALRATGQIPVDRAGQSGHSALRAAEELVEKGRMVIVYPEGSLTRDPELWPMRGKTGAVRIALERDIPVIPVAHWGTQQLMPRYGKKVVLFRRKKVDVIFGDPVDLDAFRGRPFAQSDLVAATGLVMDAITELLAEVRGEPAPAERWDPSAHRQAETGRFDG